MYDEANMSDTTLLVSVEDLINMALGPYDKNVVNYKLIQTILHILARQMRMLEQRVEIRITDEREYKRDTSSHRNLDDIKEERKSRSPDKKERARIEIERIEKAAMKAKEKAERAASKERDKAERAVSKEREKAEKATAKEKERAERGETKDSDEAERAQYKDRDKAASSKEKDKAERAASKEREKAERREREKAEKATAKGGKESQKEEKEKEEMAAGKEKRKADKEKDKAEKATVREKDKEEKASAKEKGKAEKMTKEKAEKEAPVEKGRAKSKDRKGKTASDTSIVISEVERRKEKVLVVEKGPTTRTDTRRENIEVVTRSQFDILQAMVKDLQGKAGPLPTPAMPENKKLMKELAKGTASLPDTMEAMQLAARVHAAEIAINRMGQMLQALAACGALPERYTPEDIEFETSDMMAMLEASKGQQQGRDQGHDQGRAQMEREEREQEQPQPAKSRSTVPRKSVVIDPITMPSQPELKSQRASVASIAVRPQPSTTATSRTSVAALGRQSVVSKPSMMSTTAMPAVTHAEMDAAIRGLRDELTKIAHNMTTKATSVSENASSSAKAVAEKLEIALRLDNKITTLHSLVADYADQLSGFDAGLTTQMSSFNDQINQMKAELSGGLKQLEQVNNNAETAAVMELTERYLTLVTELDQTLHTHHALTAFQAQLGDELHSLVECVEMLREQKADRDEVLDGLRDKADTSRLEGLLTTIEFNMARAELDKRLEVCHDKFRRQENVWMTALKDLTRVTENKAEITQLLAAREAAELMIWELMDKQAKLAVILGEPKAAVLTRALARDAMCGSCLVPALMEPTEKSYAAPAPLPAMRPRPLGAADEPCVPEWKPPEPPDNRDHTCHRWCGGSHTLLSDAVTRERAPPVQLQTTPTKRYTGYGADGRLYMLEEELQPCVECNKLSEPGECAPAPPPDGAGDQGPPPQAT